MSEHRIEIELVTVNSEPNTITITVGAISPSIAKKLAENLRLFVEKCDAQTQPKTIEHIRDYPVKSEGA